MANFSIETIRNQLAGPVYPVLVPFSEDGSRVDVDALERYVNFLVSNKVCAILTTIGTSRFNLLTNDEIRTVNEAVIRASNAETLTIVAGPVTGDLAVNIEFAQHAERSGADAFIAYFPERFYGNEAVYDFFKKLSESVGIGVMIHEMPFRSGYGGVAQYSLDLLSDLVALPGVVGMKEECMDPGYTYKLLRRLADKTAIIGAGSMRNYLRDHHAGAMSYLVGIGSFFPNVEKAFYSALMGGNTTLAHKIVRRYEDLYFDRAVELGWHIALKETLHMLDLMPPYERAPLPRLDSKGRARLRELLEQLQFLSLAPAHIPALG